MIRPLLWVLPALLAVLFVLPVEALGASVPLLGVIALGLLIVVIAGQRGRRHERTEEQRRRPPDTE